MNSDMKEISPWEYLLYPLVVALFFVLYTYPVFEGDFFWHLNTGEWIWNHRCLPRTDPFSFAVDPKTVDPASHRIQVILTQYWLGQLIFFGLWSIAGYKGIILARAICYTAILVILGTWSRTYTKGIIPFFLLFVVGAQLLRHSNERPQLFAFVLMPLLLYVLEKMRDGGKKPAVRYLLLPLIMLLWANIHGSFILGVVIIGIYGLCHLFSSWRKNLSYDRMYLICLAGAIGITLVNPNGFWTFVEFFRVSSEHIKNTHEYQSPLVTLTQVHSFDPYWLLLIPGLLLIPFRFRLMPGEHIFVILSLAMLSLSAGRYIPFFMFTLPIIVRYLPALPFMKRYEWSGALLVMCLFAQFNFKSTFKFRESSDFPRQAVNFINTSLPSGRIYNHSDWGGYISRFAPNHSIFIDSRVLVEDTQKAHLAAMNGIRWRELFGTYNISIAILSTRSLDRNSFAYGKPAPLVEALQKDSNWFLSYADNKAIIFVRK